MPIENGYSTYRPAGELNIAAVTKYEEQQAAAAAQLEYSSQGASMVPTTIGMAPEHASLVIGPQTIPLNTQLAPPADKNEISGGATGRHEPAAHIGGPSAPKPPRRGTLIKAPVLPIATEASVEANYLLEFGVTTELSEWRRNGDHPAIKAGIPPEKSAEVARYQKTLDKRAAQMPGYNRPTQPLPPGYDPGEGEVQTAPLAPPDPWRPLLRIRK